MGITDHYDVKIVTNLKLLILTFRDIELLAAGYSMFSLLIEAPYYFLVTLNYSVVVFD